MEGIPIKKKRFPTGINDIPDTILTHILLMLPAIEDIVTCGAVCRRWRGMTRSAEFARLHFEGTILKPERVICTPLEMADNKPESRRLDLIRTEGINMRRISLEAIFSGHWQNTTVKVMSSCHGFLCISYCDRPYSLMVCNPITKQHVELPDVEPIRRLIHVAFGYAPSTARYKLVKVYWSGSRPGRGHILTLGEPAWRVLQFPAKILGSTDPVYSQGRIHWMMEEKQPGDKKRELLVLKLDTEEFYSLRLNIKPFPRDINPYNISLVRNQKGAFVSVFRKSKGYFWKLSGTANERVKVYEYRCRFYRKRRTDSDLVFKGKSTGKRYFVEMLINMERCLVVYNRFSTKPYSKIECLPQHFRCLTLQPNLLSPVA